MDRNIIELWKERSVAISAVVKEVASVEEALQYCLDLCASAQPHEELMGPEAGEGNTLAAPGLPADQAEVLRKGCAARGLRFVDRDLRSRAGGVEVGVAWALAGLADVTAKAAAVQGTKECAYAYHDLVVPAMEALRRPADRLEMLVDKELWPMPSYGDLIFEV